MTSPITITITYQGEWNFYSEPEPSRQPYAGFGLRTQSGVAGPYFGNIYHGGAWRVTGNGRELVTGQAADQAAQIKAVEDAVTALATGAAEMTTMTRHENAFIAGLRACRPNARITVDKPYNVTGNANTLVKDWDAMASELEFQTAEAEKWRAIACKLVD